MAFLYPVAACHRHHSGLLFRNLIPAVVQEVGRVIASTSSEQTSATSGPVRYIPKPSSETPPDFRRRTPNQTGAAQSGPSGDESDGETGTDANGGNPKVSKQLRGKSRKSSSDPSRSSEAYLRVVSSANRSKGITKSNINKGERESDIPQPGLEEAGYSKLFPGDELLTLRTQYSVSDDPRSREQVPAAKSRARDADVDVDMGTSARNYAMNLLARGPQTEANLRKKLARRMISSEVIDETISELQRCGLQSDEEYVELFASSRWKGNTWGPTRIKYELLRRGLSKETVDAGLVNLFQRSDTIDTNQEEEEDLGKWGMTTEAAEHLMYQVQQRWSQGEMELSVRRRRMIGWLQRRGFTWTIIQDILKTIEAET